MEATVDGVVLEAPYEHSATIGKIAGALAKAQGAMRAASKDAQNPHFKSRYADLASCWEVARAPLAANELAFVQMTEPEGQGVSLISMLVHTSGEYLRSRLFMPLTQATPQTIGSAITYGRRYGMCALLGIAAEEDDGEAATHHQTRSTPLDVPAAPPWRGPTQQSPKKPTAAEAARDMGTMLKGATSPAELEGVWGAIVKMPFADAMRAELRKVYEHELVSRWPSSPKGPAEQ